jgi:DNA-binding winged helix-turn-helix (wHTH) protein
VSYMLEFERFRLYPQQRLLLDNSAAIDVPGRAMDVLIVLAERAGEVIAKDELIANAWPGAFVREGNLRVQINTLRRVLRDGCDGLQFISNVPKRGYSFVALVRRRADRGQRPRISRSQGVLPARGTKIIGRAEPISNLCSLLMQHRLVTVVGVAGVGKTTIAIAAARMLLPLFGQGAHWVDLATVSDPKLVPAAVAATFNTPNHSLDPMSGLLTLLHDKETLLVLDGCDLVSTGVVDFTNEISKRSPGTKVLATSRKLPRAIDEAEFRLPPLRVPDTDRSLTAVEAIKVPAVELFTERATANAEHFVLTNSNAPIVIEICRRLGGIPLAIERAALAVGYLGVGQLLSRLDDYLGLPNAGYRTPL